MPTKFTPPCVGDLRTHIAIQRVERVSDGLSGLVDTWVKVTEAWARFEAWKGTSQFQASQILDVQWWEMTMRYPPNIAILPKMRVVDLITKDTYQIYSCADPNKHRQWLYMLLNSTTP